MGLVKCFHIYALSAIACFVIAFSQEPLVYGVDVSYPIHWNIDKYTYQGRRYENLMKGCFTKYSERECNEVEADRLKMSREQPVSQYNYTEMGFKKLQLPEGVYSLLKHFFDKNVSKKKEEVWSRGYTYTNHWESRTYMVSVEDKTLQDGGIALKNYVWDCVRPFIEEWIGGHQIKPTSMYGIRVYTKGAILATHVDRLPLVSSCIINVAQDVNEPWPIEVYDHNGRAHNVTMEAGDMVLYESASILHGRPSPLNGSFYANIFVHFEPLDHNKMNKYNMDSGKTKTPLISYLRGSRANNKIGNVDDDVEYNNLRPLYNLSEEDKQLTLHHAAAAGRFGMVKKIVNEDESQIHHKDMNGWQPLHEAVRAGNTDVVKYLIENGADVASLTNSGASPLWWAKRSLPIGHSTIHYLEEIGAPEQGEL